MLLEDDALAAYINELKSDFEPLINIFLVKQRDSHLDEFHFGGSSYKIFFDLLGREDDYCVLALSAKKKGSLAHSRILSYKLNQNGIEYYDFFK